LTNFQERCAAFKKIFDLSPEASNAFKLPIFEISILEDEKSPWALVQILSPGGARGFYLVLPAVIVIEKSANHAKLMKCRFALTYIYDLLTYLSAIRAKVVMFGIKPKLMKCRFVLTYFCELLTYLSTIRAKV
jgi:hypothetical protein